MQVRLEPHVGGDTLRPLPVTSELLDRLRAWPWPGNVRELENALESLAALSSGESLDLSLLPSGRATVEVEEAPRAGLKERVDAYERGLIVAALRAAGGNRTEAVRALEIGRATLHDKLKKHGLLGEDEREG